MRSQMLMQDVLEFLIYGRIVCEISVLDPTTTPFSPPHKNIQSQDAAANKTVSDKSVAQKKDIK